MFGWLRPLLMLAWGVGMGGCLDPGAPYLTKMDILPPSIVSTSPQTGVSGVPRAGVLTVQFSEPMDPETLAPGMLLLRGTEKIILIATLPTEVYDGIDRGDVSHTIRVRPRDGTLAGNTLYEWVLSAVLTDTEGNALPQERRISFSTGP